MSRYTDHSDDGSPEAVLAFGRWKRNAHAALKGKRGRKALRDLRDALLALPEHRLIEGAVCTVGGAARVADFTEAEQAQYIAETTARGYGDEAARWAEQRQEWRRGERDAFAEFAAQEGDGVCAVGAFLWHQKVKAGMDPAEAFAAIPNAYDPDGGEALEETARLGEDAGLTFTLAWELAYRNDETYDHLTPEERWTAFVAWIDQELAEDAPVPA